MPRPRRRRAWRKRLVIAAVLCAATAGLHVFSCWRTALWLKEPQGLRLGVSRGALFIGNGGETRFYNWFDAWPLGMGDDPAPGWHLRSNYDCWRPDPSVASLREDLSLTIWRPRLPADLKAVQFLFSGPQWDTVQSVFSESDPYLPPTVVYRPAKSELYVLPLWIPLLAAIILLVLAPARRAKRFPAGRCQECGYDLTGNISGRCPECGKPT